MIRSKKLRNSARGKGCTIRLVGTCNGDPETTVLAHIGRNRGTSIKCNDSFAVFSCSSCHDSIDGRAKYDLLANPNIQEDLLRALEETQDYWFSSGLLDAKS